MKSADRAPTCEFNPGICLTTEEKAGKNLSQGSQRINTVSKKKYISSWVKNFALLRKIEAKIILLFEFIIYIRVMTSSLQPFGASLFVELISNALICHVIIKRGADKSLARPGRKQAASTEDLDFHISYL